jgi:hypothetical protein
LDTSPRISAVKLAEVVNMASPVLDYDNPQHIG